MPEIVESSDGFKWYVEVQSDRLPLNDGEASVRKFLEMVSDPNRIFVDIGCHVGSYAIRMSRLYKEVIAIDPNPRSIQILKKNMELNGVKNIKILNVGVGSKTEKMKIFLRGGSSTFLEVKDAEKVAYATVMPLDDLIEKADVIKIDVEGWEEEVMKGARRIISECKPIFVIEHHEFRDYDECKGMKERIIKMLSDYHHFDLNGVHTAYVPENFDLSTIKEVIVWHWVNKAVKNIENGKPWYYGFPYTWWYGGGIIDFLLGGPKHILREKEWLEKS